MDVEMEYTKLGSTGLDVSRLCLGCMNFGSSAPWMVNDEDASIELIERAVDAGINFLDTANVYSRGESEEIVGRAISSYDRSELVVATKVYGEMRDGPNGQGLSRKHVIDQCHASLDRLGTDYIDLYQIHRWDDDTPIAETLSALTYLVDEGLVRYVGASTMSAYEFTKALYTAELEGFERFACMQPEYNAVDRHEEANLLPVCEAEGVGVIPWSPLGGGFLTGKYERREAEADPGEGDDAGDHGGEADNELEADQEGEADNEGGPGHGGDGIAVVPAGSRGETSEHIRRRFREQNWAVLDAVRAVADQYDATPAQVATAWLLAKDVVDAPIVGPRTPEQLDDTLGALAVSLTEDEVDRIEAPIEPRWPPAGRD